MVMRVGCVRLWHCPADPGMVMRVGSVSLWHCPGVDASRVAAGAIRFSYGSSAMGGSQGAGGDGWFVVAPLGVLIVIEFW